MPASLPIDDSVNLREIAKLYEMSGASILNAVQFAALAAYANCDKHLSKDHLLDGIRKEYIKEEKII
jgi:ATP-dependent 26S proteasome regulatory subunit